MDFTKHYPRQTGDQVLAVTQIWSTRARTATIRFGADWWLKMLVNGQEVFRTSAKTGGFGTDFHQELQIPLPAEDAGPAEPGFCLYSDPTLRDDPYSFVAW